MAEFESPTFRKIQHAGEYGNACIAVMEHTYAAEAAASIVKFGKLAGGITITRVFVKHADLGDAQTYDLGFRYLTTGDGTSNPDEFFDGIDTGTAAGEDTWDGPLEIAEGNGIEIVGTNNTAAATGLVNVIVEYVYNGNG